LHGQAADRDDGVEHLGILLLDVGRLSRWPGFPFLKTIDDLKFTFQSTVRLTLLGSALSADFVTEGRCLIFLGKPGRGKTHLAVAIAYRAIQNGFDAVFTTAAQLIDELSAAFREGRLAEALTPIPTPEFWSWTKWDI
jgi:DNA replication protein DnaC